MDLERVAKLRFPSVEHAYSVRDSMLYALGLGYGSDPANRSDLKFVYEQGTGPDALVAVPSICVVLAHPGFWAQNPELGIDWVKILHGEQHFEIHAPFAPAGRVRGEFSIHAIEDKGAGKGAIVHQDKVLYDAATGTKLATVRSVLFLRGDGGCGSYGTPPAAPAEIAAAQPERTSTLATLPQSALIYRLSGDYNPIHADPAAAERGGLGKPILHGLCTMGIAVRAAIDTVAGGDPTRIRSVSVRFSKPVFPGETIRTEFFGTGNEIRFRARVIERDLVVLDRGTIHLRED